MTERTGVGKGKINLTNNEVFHILNSQEWKCDKCERDFEIKILRPDTPDPEFFARFESLKEKYEEDRDWFWSKDEYYHVNSPYLNPRRKPKNLQSTTNKDSTSKAKNVENYLLLCARCNKISLKNDQINIRISNYQKKVLQNIAAEDNQSVADYIYNLLDSKMKEDEDTKSRWLNKDK